MKKLFLSVIAIALSTTAFASSNLDQLKLNTIAKIFQSSNGWDLRKDITKYATSDFKKVIVKAYTQTRPDPDYDEVSCMQDTVLMGYLKDGKMLIQVSHN